MRALSVQATRIVLVRLDPGEDLLAALLAAVDEHGLQEGLILEGVGSLSSYHIHVVKTTNMPPGNTYVREDGPFDILSVTGLIVGGQIHAHITIANAETALGGHVEEGCRILTFGIVALAETPEAAMTGWDRPGPLLLT